MPWQIRPIEEASQWVRGGFRRFMSGTDSALKNNFVTIAGKVMTMMSNDYELRMAKLEKQRHARTADADMLPQHGADVGIYRKQPSAARGSIIGMGAANVVYPSDIRFVSGSTTYLSTAPAQASPLGVVRFSVLAEQAGAATNRDAGGLLGLADAVLHPDLGTEFTVEASGLGGGADLEDIEAFRQRILFRKANPPGAGKLSDYEATALDVPGVLKAWAFRRPNAPAFMAVYFLFADRPDRIPTEGDVLAVQAAIDAKRMIRVDDNIVVAPTPDALNPIISALVPDSEEVRTAIAASIGAMLYERTRPGIDVSTFTLPRAWVTEAISSVTGEDRHTLQWPLNDLTYTGGRYPVVGTVSFT